MKFFCLSICTLLLSISVYSQVQFNLFAGPQLTSASYTVQGVKQETSGKYGFQLGAGVKVPFENKLFFSPAIFYSLKGYKVDYTRYVFPPDPLALDNNTTFHTLETAFLLQYDFGANPGHLFIKAGPSLDFQLFGKEKFNTSTGMVDRKLSWGFNKYGHFSANMLAQFGYEMKSGLFFFGQYNHGLASINNADGGPRIRHRAVGISIGKYLGRHSLVSDTRNRE